MGPYKSRSTTSMTKPVLGALRYKKVKGEVLPRELVRYILGFLKKKTTRVAPRKPVLKPRKKTFKQLYGGKEKDISKPNFIFPKQLLYAARADMKIPNAPNVRN